MVAEEEQAVARQGAETGALRGMLLLSYLAQTDFSTSVTKQGYVCQESGQRLDCCSDPKIVLELTWPS